MRTIQDVLQSNAIYTLCQPKTGSIADTGRDQTLRLDVLATGIPIHLYTRQEHFPFLNGIASTLMYVAVPLAAKLSQWASEIASTWLELGFQRCGWLALLGIYMLHTDARVGMVAVILTGGV